jgi:hypothetical protein
MLDARAFPKSLIYNISLMAGQTSTYDFPAWDRAGICPDALFSNASILPASGNVVAKAVNCPFHTPVRDR